MVGVNGRSPLQMAVQTKIGVSPDQVFSRRHHDRTNRISS